MNKIAFDGKNYNCKEHETLLDALIRQGCEVPFSCRSGVCQVCLMRTTEGEVSGDAQHGLSDRLREKGYFLPCKCHPANDLVIAPPKHADLTCFAIVQEKRMLSDDICQVMIEPSVDVFYHAGQFINIVSEEAGVRSYSIASVPHQDYFLELHIKRHDFGLMSRWLVDAVEVGEDIEITRPAGENYYQATRQDSLLLVATGTGLAPVVGIARDALSSGHQGEIYLYHGAQDASGLYRDELLAGLDEKHGNFHYEPCLIAKGTVQEKVRVAHADLSGWWVHVSGNPETVSEVTRLVQELGATAECICADPFTVRDVPDGRQAPDATEAHNLHSAETPYPPPSPEIWEALEEGAKLTRILDEFYDAVYEDALLSPYFKNSTKQRAKEKVYSFYRRLFSGDKVYFGDRPRNAHHWMVISDEIFDHRESLLKTFMVKHGLPDAIIDKWLTLENQYRGDIVKKKPRGRMIGGSEAPAEGYGTVELSVAGVCDGCHGEVQEGVVVHYHLRTGEVFCPTCVGRTA